MSAVQTTRARCRPTIRGRVAVAGAVLAAACALGIAANRAGAIESTPVTCGEVLTVSTLVANDLAECPGDGLVVGAAGIEIDLTGRTIDGVGLGAGVLNEGFDGVTISGGTFQEFDIGVHLAAGAGDTKVRGGRFVANQEAGVLLSAAAPGTEVTANEFVGNALAVGIIDGTEGVTVADNVVSEGSGSGLEILGSNGNRIERNVFAASSDGGIVLEGASHNVLLANMVGGVSDAALLVTTESNGNRIQGNVLSASDGGIIVDRSIGNVLLGNVAHGMSDVGIDLDSASGTVVMGNDLRSNGEGIALFDSSGNRIEGNDTSESSGTAIAVEGTSFGNTIVRNVADASGATGISVIALAEAGDGNLLDGNATGRNPSGGISITAPGHTLRRNVAIGNGGWGINAADGTIDGGGNFAAGNGEQAQCVGVVCDGTLLPPVDVIPPETAIVDGPRNPTASRTATIAFEVVGEAGGDVALFECSLDGAAFVPCTSPQAFSGLELGDHTLAVRATDVAGNVEPVPAVYAWTIVAAPDVDCGAAVTVTADADAWIDENSADANKGADSVAEGAVEGPGRQLPGARPVPPARGAGRMRARRGDLAPVRGLDGSRTAGAGGAPRRGLVGERRDLGEPPDDRRSGRVHRGGRGLARVGGATPRRADVRPQRSPRIPDPRRRRGRGRRARLQHA